MNILAALALAAQITLQLHGNIVSGKEVKYQVTVKVPLNNDNRKVWVMWDGEGPKSSAGLTSKQLDEYTDRVTFNFFIRLTPGTYQIVAVLDQAGGKRIFTPVQTVVVIGIGPEE